MGRVIGLDLSKDTAEVAVLLPGREEPLRRRFAARPAALRKFAEQLGPDDRVVFESCTNAVAFHRLLCEHAGQVVVSNPMKTRIIAEAKVKTDKVDAEILARLLAADFLPTVWVPDAAIDQLRHLVSHRHGLVKQRTQVKNRIHAILHRNLIATNVSDLFGKAGRRFLQRAKLPATDRHLLDADLRTIDFLTAEIDNSEKCFAETCYRDPDIHRLMTIHGVSLVSAVALKAAIGEIGRFRAPANLVSYFGLNPAVYQSGKKAYNGHISRHGRSHARGICTEVAQQLVRVPGPFHAFFQRLRRRKPYNVAITAVTRKLTVLVWHMLIRGEDYRYSPPALTRRKRNQLRRLATGETTRRPCKGESVPNPADDKLPGILGEQHYGDFIDKRFGPDGPLAVDSSNEDSKRA